MNETYCSKYNNYYISRNIINIYIYNHIRNDDQQIRYIC